MPKPGKIFTLSRDELASIVKESKSHGEVLRYMGYKSPDAKRLKKRLREEGISTTHFKIRIHPKASTFAEFTSGPIAKRLAGTTLKDKIRKEKLLEDYCAACNMEPVWNGKPLNFHLDHIDGNPLNNKLSNLRFLCPNCHIQTLTYALGHKRTSVH